MTNRKQKVKELMESFHALKRSMAFRHGGSANMPRITPSQWGALMFIGGGDESTVKDVAKALGITSSAATQLIDGLVASGYVARQEHTEDRRRVTLALSKKTKTQIEKMKEQSIKQFLKFFEALNDTEFDQYIALNKKIAGVLKK
jgi:DNA-binding MarR family transcriptional regulator